MDELYPGYDPMIDTNPITCWGHPTAEQLEESAKLRRENTAIYRLFGAAYYEDVYRLNQRMLEMLCAQAKEEYLRRGSS